MEKWNNRLKRVADTPWLAEGITLLSGMIYLVQIWWYALTQDSMLDEGVYLLKGYLFVTGVYEPYQAFGPETNKMPLSFLIPGYFQKIFGPGLRTGRYYAILLGILFIIGVWILARRLGGKWGGAAAVLMITLNPANLKIYSLAVSEGLVATMLVWVLVLTLGEKRPRWQLIAGACLAGIIPLTRINMSPVLPFVLGYIFWEHGIWSGIWASLGGLTVLVGGFAAFSPGIIPWWLRWIPERLTPFWNQLRWNYDQGEAYLVRNVSLRGRFISLFEGVRFHFAAIWGAFTTWLLWPEKWGKRSDFRIAVFLSVLFALLLGLHGWASLFRDVNVYGFSVYLSFFQVLAVLLVVVTIQNWRWELPGWRQYLIFILVGIMLFGLAYTSVYQLRIFQPLSKKILRGLSNSLNNGESGVSSWQVWDWFQDRFVLRQETIVQGAFGLFVLVGVILSGLLFFLIRWIVIEKAKCPSHVFPAFILVILFGLGSFLAPLEILGGGRHNYDCRLGVVSSYEQAADYISEHVNKGEQIFWMGSFSQTVLLEIEGIQFYPQTLNAKFSRHKGGDSEQLAKHGLWNEELMYQWMEEADVILIEHREISDWFLDYLKTPSIHYDEVPPTQPVGCRKGAQIRIYRRMR